VDLLAKTESMSGSDIIGNGEFAIKVGGEGGPRLPWLCTEAGAQMVWLRYEALVAAAVPLS
jgi:hypothetical protein